MAKGKKTAERTDKRPENDLHQKVTSGDTKENRPVATIELDCTRKAGSPKKATSPLNNTSGVFIQDPNNTDDNYAAKLDKDATNEAQSELRGTKVAHQPQQKKMTTYTNVALTDHRKVPPTKPRSQNPRKGKEKKMENNASQNRKVTDFYPIRRSNRKTKGELKNEEDKHLDDLIKNGVEEGMQVRVMEGKGRGVFAVRRFKKGDFVVEYHGDLLEQAEAKRREARYAQEPQTGCYMYYFQYQAKTYCVDATRETGRLGRLINHSKAGNCQTKLHAIDGSPHLILVASRDIEAAEELLYDYGDRSKEAILAHPWLKH
ncbi:lysine methyltransferase 5Ab [Syngnathoides biaculeatus]|uniref:lysine methyltransferase 5Ab n=1 Tax=Syngnathoides biaculeatus TaxID=300417 RepID=UPI002ADD8EDC|nr:lysine methyltransferase 5Ab [Syngnathoides biaculeatus]